MKHINRTTKKKTTLSVTPDKLVLDIGTDVNEESLSTFLSVLDNHLTDGPTPNEPYYGHFSFSKNKMEMILTPEKDKPGLNDRTYSYEL